MKIPHARQCNPTNRSNKATQEQIVAYSVLVWASIAHGIDTPENFKIFTTEPNNTSDLDNSRNNRKLNYVMMGANMWNSLTSDFQIFIMMCKHEFEQSNKEMVPFNGISSGEGLTHPQ